MQTTVTDVAFGQHAKLVVGIAHNALGGQVERIHHNDAFTFLDARFVGFQLNKNLCANQSCRNIIRVQRETAIDSLQSLVQLTRHAFEICKPSKHHGIGVFLADRLSK